jgi:L-threonylcarbamoyladenylate synthase
MLAIRAGAPPTEVLTDAASVLRDGGLVAFPTESFYGLGARALDPRALARVFAVKGRPESKPLLVLVDGPAMVETLATDISAGARDLMERHWPGALTIVLQAAADLPTALTAGTGTIGVRMPGHPLALGLVRVAGFPITAPSANPSGQPPPRTADAVRDYFMGQVDLILDSGPTEGGAGSTVADCTAWPPRVLRQGPIHL